MAKALIVFGSTTGNTEAVAKQIGQVLTQKGLEVSIQEVSRTKVEDLGDGFDITLLGSSTWGDSEIEFQEDFAPFYEAMDQANLKGKKMAIFGCGDSSYEFFCGAVDLLEEKVGALGGQIVNEPLRIDGDPIMAEVTDWAQEVAAGI